MASYKINYHLTNCNTTAASSENYNTDGDIIRFCGKAVDGCYFCRMMVITITFHVLAMEVQRLQILIFHVFPLVMIQKLKAVILTVFHQMANIFQNV